MNILIVEDDLTSMKLAHVVVSSEGYTAYDADSAEKALGAIKQRKPELIIMDLNLPGMSGLDLTQKLKNNPATRDIPVIAVTFYPSRFKREEALAAGCDAYFVKPINTRELPKAIAKAASKKE